MSNEQKAGEALEGLMQELFGIPIKKVPEEVPVPDVLNSKIWSDQNFDDVEAPSHYHLFDGQLQVIELVKELLTTEEYAGYLKGNMIKYLMRADKKNGMQDYKKLSQYVNMYIEEDNFNG